MSDDRRERDDERAPILEAFAERCLSGRESDPGEIDARAGDAARLEDIRFAALALGRWRERPPEPVAPEAGTSVGDYRIEGVLGRGGMGVVYAAMQSNPRRRVALKMLRSGGDSHEALRRFEREARILALLDHPGIAKIFEAGTVDRGDGPRPFFAMELVDGIPVDRYAAAKALGDRERLELVAAIADAIDHAHRRGVVHRDLKPRNVLVDASGRPKVLDFGVAGVTAPDLRGDTSLTSPGQFLGTAAYMSPEQCDRSGVELDGRSDVYSLGVIAYELLAGRLPHDVAGRSLAECARAIAEDEPQRLGSLRKSLGGDVETIVAKAIEKDRFRRYATAAEFAEDVRRHFRKEPIRARAPSVAYRARKFASRRRDLVVGIVLALAAAAATALLLFFVFGARVQFKTAMSELGARELETRLAAIATIESLVMESPDRLYRQGVEALCGFVRDPIRDEQTDQKRLRRDIQQAMETIVRLRDKSRDVPIDLREANLDGAQLRNLDMSGFRFTSVSFVGAQLNGSDLSGAHLAFAKLRNAQFQGVRARGANFMFADATGGTNPKDGAAFDDADLSEADFRSAEVAGATFIRSKVEGLLGANTDWTRARGLTPEQLDAMDLKTR